jgi:hypothetical protein
MPVHDFSDGSSYPIIGENLAGLFLVEINVPWPELFL